MSTIDSMLENHAADSWSDTVDAYVFDDPQVGKLERLESYVDYCFETYDNVSRVLDRDQIQVCVADWGRRRGLHKGNARMSRREFGQRVTDTKYRQYENGSHAVFVATALVGISPEDDKGVGWKATARHEIGHAIDYEERGHSNHDSCFKAVMRRFGEGNDGMSSHGYMPRVFR